MKNMNRSIISEKIESWIENYPNNSGQGLDDFKGEFYQTFKEESTTTLSKLFKKLKMREHFQIHSMRAALHDTKAKHCKCRMPIVLNWLMH